jgi:hypothetical protein
VGVLTDTDGTEWIVDRTDFPKVKDALWINNESGYAKSRLGYLHKVIFPGVSAVDHKDRDSFNNRKSNLRDGSHGVNNLNRDCAAASGYKGVHAIRENWQGRVVHRGKRVYFGTFKTVKETARAIWKWAKGVGKEEFYRNPDA